MNFRRYRFLAFVYCLLILSVSSIPGESIPDVGIEGWEYLAHLFEYTILGWLIVASLEQKQMNSVLIIILGGIMFGAFDEFWQSLIPGRLSSVYDWITDSVGVITGGLLNIKYSKKLIPENRV